MNNQFSYLQSLGNSQAQWTSVLFFLVIGTLYFFAPVVGYAEGKRGILLASLWTMIAKLAIGTFLECLLSLQILYAPPPATTWNVAPAPAAPGQPFPILAPPPAGPAGPGGFLGKFQEQLPAVLTLAETVAFLAAIILFVLGLQKLVRREPLPNLKGSPE
jgi:hypothetical protein